MIVGFYLTFGTYLYWRFKRRGLTFGGANDWEVALHALIQHEKEQIQHKFDCVLKERAEKFQPLFVSIVCFMLYFSSVQASTGGYQQHSMIDESDFWDAVHLAMFLTGAILRSLNYILSIEIQKLT